MIIDYFGNPLDIQPPISQSQPDPPAIDARAKFRGEVNAAQRRYDSAMQNLQDARTALNHAIEINIAAYQNLIDAKTRLSEVEGLNPAGPRYF